ncbi:MAG: YvcK family protein [Chloroflexota bacterium]|nr:YvcK family protein [Chloroflexota bacterium]
MAARTVLADTERRARLRLWLQPGLSVKRWVGIYVVALTLVSLGLGLVLAHLYRTAPFPEPFYYVTLQFIPRFLRGVLLLIAGGVLMAWATWRLVATFVGVLVPHYRTLHPGRLALSDALWAQRVLSRGPRVVAIGGGTGLSTLLRGLKMHSSNLTAVVTVCDDGGSSGRLRRDLRVLPPGDFRQCIAALADSDPLVTALFEHRFQGEGSELKGHAFGNLFIAALAQITGSFERALEESSRVLNVRGRIVPSTLEDVVLCAELADRSTVQGESLIPELASGGAAGHGAPGASNGHSASTPGSAVAAVGDADHSADGAVAEPTVSNPIRRVFLHPEHPPVYPEVVRALLDADLIVIGPGSLYTSILPNLLVGDLARALCWSRAVKVYVCNVATQPGETDHYDVVDHVETIFRHLEQSIGLPVGGSEGRSGAGSGAQPGGAAPFTHVLVNSNLSPDLPDEWGVTRPMTQAEALARRGVQVIERDLVDEARPTRHHSGKLAQAMMAIYAQLRPAPAPSPLTTLRGWSGMLGPVRATSMPRAGSLASAAEVPAPK